MQEEMQQAIASVVVRWHGVTTVLALFRVVEAGLLLAGGIVALGLKPVGRKLLLAAFFAAIPFDIAHSVVTMIVQRQTMHATEDFMPRMMEASAPPGQQMPAGVVRMVTMFMEVVGFLAIAMMVVWLAAKLAFYIASILYLRRPAIAGLYGVARPDRSTPLAPPPG